MDPVTVALVAGGLYWFSTRRKRKLKLSIARWHDHATLIQHAARLYHTGHVSRSHAREAIDWSFEGMQKEMLRWSDNEQRRKMWSATTGIHEEACALLDKPVENTEQPPPFPVLQSDVWLEIAAVTPDERQAAQERVRQAVGEEATL